VDSFSYAIPRLKTPNSLNFRFALINERFGVHFQLGFLSLVDSFHGKRLECMKRSSFQGDKRQEEDKDALDEYGVLVQGYWTSPF